MQGQENQPTSDNRISKRSSVYVSGVLKCGDLSTPAKIRNLSSSGALVEAPTVPSKGSLVQLMRGSLVVDGLVAWTASGRCGVHFGSVLNVKNWTAPVTNTAQKRIDQTVSTLKAGLAPPAEPGAVVRPSNNSLSAFELGPVFREINELLGRIASDLSQNEVLLQRHPVSLQGLDIVTQTIDAISDLVSGSGSADTIRRLESLRVSRAEALREGL